ncbi:MAG: hypothetical protein ACRDQW_17380 [Haloechinothrix sp.]
MLQLDWRNPLERLDLALERIQIVTSHVPRADPMEVGADSNGLVAGAIGRQ